MLQNRVELIHQPTPCYRLERMSEHLGSEIWIKRDDLTPFGGGGNKARKLEYWLGLVFEDGYDTVVTSGAVQSNFLRQCAAACRVYGIDFAAVAMHSPYPDEDRRVNVMPTRLDAGNSKLVDLLGFTLSIVPNGSWEELASHTQIAFEKSKSEGKKPLLIPPGGSAGIGALGFVRAVEELLEQCSPFDQIVTASGSGSTQTGLAYGLRRAKLGTHVVGICTDNEPEMTNDFADIAEELDELLLSSERMGANDFDLRIEFAGEGYQARTEGAVRAQEMFARTEGIFLDPVYTAKAADGLITLAQRGELPGRTLFWHTGGFPAIFAEPMQPSS